MRFEVDTAVRERLQQLADEDGGRLTPQAVVADARLPGSPLHKLFTWDQSKGFEKYLVDRAREVIRSVRVVVRKSETVVRTPLFVRDPTAAPRQAGYIAVSRLRNDVDASRDAVVAEFARAADALRRARAIATALDLGEEIDGVIHTVDGLRSKALETAQAGHA